MVRITSNMIVNQFLRNLMTLNDRLITNQFKLSKGVNFAKPSDGPLEVGRILNFYSTEAAFDQFKKNMTDGASQVEYLDTLLQDMVERVTNTHTKLVHGANDVLQKADRRAVALEIDQYLNSLYQDSQTRFRDKYIFAGFRTLMNPFKGTFSKWDSFLGSIEYLGDRGKIGRRIGDFTRLPINIRGHELFLERTYTLEGKILPPDVELGFSGTLTINGIDIKIETSNTLEDIRDKINNIDNIKVFASTDSGFLKLESTTSSETIKISDDQQGMLLDNLGLHVRGAFTRGITAPTMPVIDSTGAIFDAAGAVANLVYDDTNNTLNIHLGSDANDGVAAAYSIRIPPKTYADAAELAAAIQTEVDKSFGQNKIIVEEVAGALRFTSYATGAAVGTNDLQIGGEIDSVWDTASDSANLNLVAGPSPAPLTDAQTAGTDGTDKFTIDIGKLIRRSDQDPEPVTIDLRAANTGTLAELIDEINYQISQSLVLRGTVRASEFNGRVMLETVKTGYEITADQLQIADVTAGTLAGLGLQNAPSAAYIDGVPPPGFPITITTGVNDTIIVDIGPTVSRSGVNHDPITMTLRAGTYNDINELCSQVNLRINSSPELYQSIVAVVEGPPGGEYLRIRSIDEGSDVEGADLVITGGTALADLGLAPATAIDGGGVSEGKGIELLPKNIFNTMIEIRDSLLDLASLSTPINRLVDSEYTLVDLYDGDKITFEQGGRSLTITYRAFDKIEDMIIALNDFLGAKAEARLDRCGRIVIENKTNQKIEGLKISATSADGLAERTLFNEIFKIDDTVLAFSSVATDVLMDPKRHDALSESLISKIEEDMENFLRFQAMVGATANRLIRTTNITDAKDFNIKSLRNEIEAADIAEVIMKITQDEAILQASLNVGARIIMPTLLDYLR